MTSSIALIQGAELLFSDHCSLTVDQPSGFAFVEFFHVSDANNAIINVNGTKIGGRKIVVDHAIAKDTYEKMKTDAVVPAQAAVNETTGAHAVNGDDIQKDETDVGDESTDENESDQDAENQGKEERESDR